MLIKWLIFLISLMAHFWLWGHWSLDSSMGDVLMLGIATLLLITMIILPLRRLIHKREVLSVFQTKTMMGIFYAYVLIIIFLSIVSFTGIIKYLLPIKIFLLAIYVFLKFKLKKSEKKS